MPAAARHAITTDPELDGYLRELHAIVDDVHALVDPLPASALDWRPAPGRWSIAQCLDHLTLAWHQSVGPIDAMIEETRRRGLTGSGPFVHRGIIANLFIRSMEPPVRRMRAKSFRTMVPPADRDAAAVLADFFAAQSGFEDRLLRAAGLDLARVRRRNAARISMTLGQWFRFTFAHERRHVWQAHQVRGAPGFPA